MRLGIRIWLVVAERLWTGVRECTAAQGRMSHPLPTHSHTHTLSHTPTPTPLRPPGQGNRFDKYGGACNLSELNALLKGTVMVRRLKNEVLAQLPKKRRQQVCMWVYRYVGGWVRCFGGLSWGQDEGGPGAAAQEAMAGGPALV